MRHTGKVSYFGPADRCYVSRILRKVSVLIDIPKDLKFCFVSKRKAGCTGIRGMLPESAFRKFREVWLENHLAFYYRFGRIKLIVVFLTPENRYLLKDEVTFIGLLLHETAHALLDSKGLHSSIENSYKRCYLPLLNDLKWSGINAEKLYPVMVRIGATARLCLKEMYMIRYLIKKGGGRYLINSYEKMFPPERCPKPVFYKKNRMRTQLRSSPALFQNTVEFTLILLSTLLAFEKYDKRHAEKFIVHVQRCYMVNIHEMSRDFQKLKIIFRKRFSESKNFHREYFNAVYKGIRRILSG